MIPPPPPPRIRKPELEIPHKRRRNLIHFDQRRVAAGTGVVAESELEMQLYQVRFCVFLC